MSDDNIQPLHQISNDKPFDALLSHVFCLFCTEGLRQQLATAKMKSVNVITNNHEQLIISASQMLKHECVPFS
jgi:hypothetical protein